MGSLFRELQAVLSVYLGIMVEGAVTGLSAVAIPAMLRCLLFPSLIGSCPSREQEVGSDEKGAKEEKISWDFLSSALPVISASVEELSWFGGPPKSNYPEFHFQLK